MNAKEEPTLELLTTANLAKFFSFSQPGLVLFYNSDLVTKKDAGTIEALNSLNQIHSKISETMAVAKIDTRSAIGRELANECNIDDVSIGTNSFLRIITVDERT